MKKTHKENNTKVIIPKEIITYLMDLADTLFEKDYYSYIGLAKVRIIFEKISYKHKPSIPS